MYRRKYWGRKIRKVRAIEPYASLIGTDLWNLDPDPIWRDMQVWLQELRRARKQTRNKRGQFCEY